MPLIDAGISIDDSDLPDDVVAFIREAESRIGRFIEDDSTHIASFVPSNFVTVYRALRAIANGNLAPGNSFCEWGSGFGVVASLAAMLNFDVCGIEIEGSLVDESRKLSEDFDLAVEFIHGSFVPAGGEAFAEAAFADSSSEYFWIVTDADDAYGELGLDPEDFDIVFAYPWPGDESLVTSLFERYAGEGALLLRYGQFDSLQLQRKVHERPGAAARR